MDIRKFFGKTNGKKKPVKNKPLLAAASNADTMAQTAPAATAAAAAASKRKENDGTDEPEIRASLTDPSPPKKQKSEDDDDRVEVSKEAFFRQACSSEPTTRSRKGGSLPREKASNSPKNQKEWVEVAKKETEKRSPEPTWVEVSKEEILDDTTNTESNQEAVVSASALPFQEDSSEYKKKSPKPSFLKK
jgi:hypothetical protein